VKLCTLATSLGGVEDYLAALGVDDPCNVDPGRTTKGRDNGRPHRLSVGVEDIKDLSEDLTQALGQV
jgi:cystathionine beta-lyase/cystathionine gamma-synthase